MLHHRIGAGLAALAVVAGAATVAPGLANASPVASTGGSLARPAALPAATAPTTITSATSASSPRVPTPTVTPPKIGVVLPVPESPGVFPLQTSPSAVVVSWTDRSTDEQAFIVYRRDAQGNWQNVHEEADA